MKFIRTDIEDLIVIKPQVHEDERGYFVETFREDKFESFLGYKVNFCQENESKSDKGVLRGLHYQEHPYTQSKLIRVIEGKILDIAVDLRKGSPTFGQYFSIELSSENKTQLFLPRGFAHGFIALENNTIFSYKVDNYYNPQADKGIAFNDTSLNIDWKLDESEFNLSSKDQVQPLLDEVKRLFDYEVDYYQKI